MNTCMHFLFLQCTPLQAHLYALLCRHTIQHINHYIPILFMSMSPFLHVYNLQQIMLQSDCLFVYMMGLWPFSGCSILAFLFMTLSFPYGSCTLSGPGLKLFGSYCWIQATLLLPTITTLVGALKLMKIYQYP